jgi:hypothetical protein
MKIKKTRPGAWKTGPDPELHRRYLQWLQQKNQAQFRKELWDLPFETWMEIWGDRIELRGRQCGQLSMIRKNYREAWHRDNVILVTREEQSAIQVMVTKDKKLRKLQLEPNDK